MAPSVDGTPHTFIEHGLYDGLFLMRDEESGTYWDHMTGEAVYGPLTGTSLEVRNVQMTNPAQALAAHPDALIALSDRQMGSDERVSLGGLLASVGSGLSRMFSSTVEEEDGRRPTLDLGLGLWEGETARYYPYDVITGGENAILDRFQDRTVLVYLDPAAYALAAMYVEVDGFEWDGKVLRLSDGSRIQEGVLYGPDGARARPDRPLQVFTRWYGFSLTFPETGIFEGPAGR